MRFYKKQTLAVKLTLAIFITNTLVLTVLGVYASRRFAESIESQLQVKSEVPGTLMNSGALSYAMARDTLTLSKLVGSTVKQALVLEQDGHVFYSSNQKLEGSLLEELDPDLQIFDQLSASDGSIQVLRKVYNAGNTRSIVTPLQNRALLNGYLWLVIDTSEAVALKHRTSLVIFSGGLFCILLCGFVQSMLVHRIIIPRLNGVINCLKEVGRGNLTVRIPGAPLGDEIGVMEEAVNAMVAETAERTRQREELTTELEKSKVDAERASRAKSEFLANTSHEVRTPLNGILGMTEFLMESDLKEEQRQYVDIIRKSGEGLLRIINSILDLSRVERGQLHIEMGVVDLRELFAEVHDFFAPSLVDRNIILDTSLLEQTPRYVRTDRGCLRQILLNLIANAVKFTEAGSIKLHAEAVLIDVPNHTCEITFSVSDTGIGIPEELQEKVFDAFTQADGSHTRQHGGTGLGLNISRQLVERLGGTRLSVLSKEGEGSTFFFTLPLQMEAAPAIPVAGQVLSSAVEGVDALGGLILVVEDNKVNQLVVRKLLNNVGYESVVAENGAEALSALGLEGAEPPRHFDLILMDIQMPVMDGIEATRRIRESGMRDIPIIALTADAMDGAREKFIAHGMNDYMSKPICKNSFLKMAKRYISMSREDVPYF